MPRATTARVLVAFLVVSTTCFYLPPADSFRPSHEPSSFPRGGKVSLKVSSSAWELDLSPRPRKRARGALPGTNDNNNKSSSSNNNNNNNNSDPSYIQWNHQKDLW
eukprot:CAMPEP_0201220592 /NCGR_PEP_ID=MMETSP0851-20130426/191554_1 /ASSEMBLY_ACC=CAM_ASM_000631 /TAXON_ID=183588 /ORGANISM="Pseudo-nitzschia fraudulenta, Strain WWA7" /LENGTH=105 /DNA_ID=CAMNT_0047510321 /DNA_START=1824 /DNA_END=2138 /DNA_ORIENTATION=-